MPLLDADDPLPYRPSRVTVNGTSGSGKSTLARRLAGVLELPYTEMDSLFHGPGWVPRPDFVENVEAFTSAPRWVCEFQYDAVRPLLADRADLMVWLDLPVPQVMWRLTTRTLDRRVRRVTLANGEREAPLRTVFTDPENVLRWGWSTRHDARSRAQSLVASHADLPVVRLRSQGDLERWVQGPLSAVR